MGGDARTPAENLPLDHPGRKKQDCQTNPPPTENKGSSSQHPKPKLTVVNRKPTNEQQPPLAKAQRNPTPATGGVLWGDTLPSTLMPKTFAISSAAGSGIVGGGSRFSVEYSAANRQWVGRIRLARRLIRAVAPIPRSISATVPGSGANNGTFSTITSPVGGPVTP